MAQRIINISGEISQEVYDSVFECLIELEIEHKPITVYLNSVGGDVRQAMALYDLLSTSNCEIIGIVVGNCYSATPLILQACKKRLATPNSEFMLHQGSFNCEAVHGSEMKSVFEADLADNKKHNGIVFAKSKNPKKLKRYLKAGKYFSADEAVELGLIDGIIRHR